MKYDISIIGAGVVGLATAYHLSKNNRKVKIAVIDKENEVAAHQSSHNSGVIHSGVYYKPGSLKALNCRRGYELLLKFARKYKISHETCGKLIVATNQQESQALRLLSKRAIENKLKKSKLLNQQEFRKIEPYCNGIEALFIPETGIIDFKQYAHKLKELLQDSGVDFLLGEKVTSIKAVQAGIRLQTPEKVIESKRLVSCGGLYSDRLAKMTDPGFDQQVLPFRGEYYKLKDEYKYLVNNLIYPVADSNFPFLGVHLTRMVSGDIEAGPNAVLAYAREGYTKSKVNASELFEILKYKGFHNLVRRYYRTGLGELWRSYSKAAFTRALQKLVPEISKDALESAPAGVRAQLLNRDGTLFDDFKILYQGKICHVVNAPSPAATSSLAIGETIAREV